MMKRSSIKRLIIIMIGFLLTTSLYGQTITKNFKGTPLKIVLEEVEKQTGYSFAFNADEVDLTVPVTANFRDAGIKEVLPAILPQNLQWTINGKQIAISQKPRAQRSAQPSKGTVLSKMIISSADNQPVIGAGVVIEGTKTGTTSDVEGRFTIKVDDNTKNVVFSCVGYVTKTMSVSDLSKIQVVVMDEDSQKLEDVVVVGFGTQKKESMVGAVQAIKPGELKQTSSSLSTAFAGKIAGVISVQSSGEPGTADGANFWIRGISTFGSGQTPLYIVDGVEVTQTMLNQIAPETIESFSILKDATATSLYGSRGANGVMIITTKNGRNSERMAINVRVETGSSAATIRPEAANGLLFMNTFNEALISRGKDPYYSSDKIENTMLGTDPYLYPNVDWYSVLFKDRTLNQNFNVNMTGGGKKVDYFMNVTAFNENGIIKKPDFSSFDTNINSQKYLFQSNVNAWLTPTTKVSLKMNTQLHYQHAPATGTSTLFGYTLTAMPADFAPVLPGEEEDTFVRFGTSPRWTTGYNVNPLAQLARGYSNTFNGYFTSSLSVDQNLDFITKGLKLYGLVTFYNYINSSVSYTSTPFLYYIQDYSYDTEGNVDYDMLLVQQGNTYMSVGRSNGGQREISAQAKVDWNRTFGRHTIGATLVYHQKEKMMNVAASDEYASLPYREQGIAGRLTYDYDKRYLLEANFGYNGSENFAVGKRFGLFPSIAGGWVISNESFWKPLKNTVNLFKIRASYGLVGNDVISSSYTNRFPYLSTVNMNKTYDIRIGPNFDVKTGPSISVYGNQDATWETSKKLDLGVELGIKDEVNLIVDYFKEHRSGIFMQRTSLVSSFGLSGISPWGNIGKVDNEGFDASLDFNKVVNRDLVISARSSVTYAHNTIVYMEEPDYQWDYQHKQGKSINSMKVYVFDRYFTDEDDIKNSPDQSALATLYPLLPGDAKYRDLNNDGKIDSDDMMWTDETSEPQLSYGFGFTVTWKHFDVSAFFQGIGKRHLLMTNFHPFSTSTDPGTGLMKWIADDHWTENNPRADAAYPRLSDRWNDNNTVNSTLYMKDASFLRLKNAELGYTWKMMRIYVSGTNLLLFSKFKYWDPEKGGGTGLTYPLQKTFNVGLQLNL